MAALPSPHSHWLRRNRLGVLQAIAQLKVALLQYQETQETPPITLPEISQTPRLAQLQHKFKLSDFELQILLLCIGQELDSELQILLAQLQNNEACTYVTLLLALKVLPQGHWDVFSPQSTLRSWRLVQFGPHHHFSQAPMKIDPRIFCYVIGEDALDETLQPWIRPLNTHNLQRAIAPTTAQGQVVDRLVTHWQQAQQVGDFPVLLLQGPDSQTNYQLAGDLCDRLEWELRVMTAMVLPSNFEELQTLCRRWEREALLRNWVLLLDCHGLEGEDRTGERAIQLWLEAITTPLIICGDRRFRSDRRTVLNFVVPPLSQRDQRQLWQHHLGPAADQYQDQLDQIVSQFNLTRRDIDTICQGLVADASGRSPGEQLWENCRRHAQPKLEDLAQRIEAWVSWEDLILEEEKKQVLQDIALHVRQRGKVYEQWGFGGKSQQGLGITALFSGASGTGKTLAASVLAQVLNLDLYRIDLSAMISKYIGETEKNLRKVFDAAEGCGAVLLFDEADAIFGKRSEVKDSHDRHANIEVSYLLQRMESYRGLAILTTNLKGSLDQAFLRRIRFIVEFPFPSQSVRQAIWQQIFPAQTPLQDLNYRKLSALNVAGGNIRNIALNAAFYAAEAGEKVQMKHLLRSAQAEYAKLERPLTDLEIKGWV